MAGGVAGHQGADRVAGAGRVQRHQQRGHGWQVLQADVLHDPGGEDIDRPGCPGRVQGRQQLNGVPAVADADLAGRVAVQQGPDRIADVGRPQFVQ